MVGCGEWAHRAARPFGNADAKAPQMEETGRAAGGGEIGVEPPLCAARRSIPGLQEPREGHRLLRSRLAAAILPRDGLPSSRGFTSVGHAQPVRCAMPRTRSRVVREGGLRAVVAADSAVSTACLDPPSPSTANPCSAAMWASRPAQARSTMSCTSSKPPGRRSTVAARRARRRGGRTRAGAAPARSAAEPLQLAERRQVLRVHRDHVMEASAGRPPRLAAGAGDPRAAAARGLGAARVRRRPRCHPERAGGVDLEALRPPARSTWCRNTASASGDRQMLPRHTNSTPDRLPAPCVRRLELLLLRRRLRLELSRLQPANDLGYKAFAQASNYTEDHERRYFSLCKTCDKVSSTGEHCKHPEQCAQYNPGNSLHHDVLGIPIVIDIDGVASLEDGDKPANAATQASHDYERCGRVGEPEKFSGADKDRRQDHA